jgi:hypothetical protein
LTIYCLAHYLNNWRKDHNGSYPEELIIQFDGGSENANQPVMAYLEWLVATRAVKKVLYSRLPTGHTHEDIDRCFSVLWNHFQGMTIHTPQEYVKEVKRAFEKGTYRVDFHDVRSVPDYESWLRPHMGSMARLHKMDLTQHQFR